jgi:mRNA interferase MazF
MIKGEIWWANLPDDPYGSEPGKRRPVVIIQNDLVNRSDLRTTVCASIISNMKLAQMPGNIILEKAVSGLEKHQLLIFRKLLRLTKHA